MDKEIALGLSAANLVIWGSWSLFRVNCAADGPVFLVLFLIGQWITALVCALAFSNTLFSMELSYTHTIQAYTPVKIFVVLLGGFFAANGDFLCSCACNRIPVSIAFPVYAGFCLVVGIILTYVVERGRGSNPLFLFLGLFSALCAVGSLALAEAFSTASIDRQKRQNAVQVFENSNLDDVCKTDNSVWQSDEAIENGYTPSLEYTSPIKCVAHSEPSEEVKDMQPCEDKEVIVNGKVPIYSLMRQMSRSSQKIARRINTWVLICLFGGVIAGLWSPLSNLSRMPPRQITHPSTLLFLFECGSLAGMPVMLAYYGMFVIVKETGCEPVYPHSYIYQAYKLPIKDKFWGCLSGAMVALGYACYFEASDSISPTIALGIASCEPLATIVFGVLFASSLTGTTSLQKIFMFISSVLFIIAVALMTISGQ